MRKFKSLILVSAMLAIAGTTYAAGHAGAPMGAGAAKKDMPMAGADTEAMTDGEIRKVDMASKKITIKHGEIKNLDMPPMSMVFQVKDPAMLEKVKTGDKIRFKAEKANGAVVVTDIQPAK